MALDDPKRTLTLEIPSKSQVSSLATPPTVKSSWSIHTLPSCDDFSVQTPSTTTIETTESELTTLPTTIKAKASCSSLPALNVKFAPLPELLPRKRRSNVPLGMAARGQMLRRRSGYRGRVAPPMWTHGKSEEYRRHQEELAARHARCSAYAAYAAAREEEGEEDEDENDSDWPRRKKKGGQVDEDDPLQVLGRMVKVAGRTLWKKVSNKDIAAAASSTPKPKNDDDDGNRRSITGSPPLKASRLPSPPLRPILGIRSSIVDNKHVQEEEEEEQEEEEEKEEGRVWEEEIGDSFPRNVSQTETIIEGRAVYSRLTSKVEAMNLSPPPSPTIVSSLFKPPSTKNISPFKAKQTAP